MKSLDVILKEVEKDVEITTQEDKATRVLEKLRSEIGGNKSKLIVYKAACSEKVDLNLPMFWMATGAALFALVSAIITLFDVNSKTMNISLMVAASGILVLILLVAVYYMIVYNTRKKYSLMTLALEQIEIELNK